MFKEAKLKLTGWYLIIIMVITLSFSTLVYTAVNNATERVLEAQNRRLQRQFNEFYRGIQPPFGPMIDPSAITEIRQRTLNILVAVNIGVLLLSATLGYFLAGQTLRPIEEMLNKQKRFISDAAHELKTPLTAMKTDLEVTLRDKDITLKKGIEGMKSAVEEIDKLHGFANRLLTQSKFQNKNSDLHIEEVRIDELIKEIADKLKATAKKKNVTIETVLPEITIQSDKTYLKELFTNLIENSVKYNKPSKTSSIVLSADKWFVYVDISDQGEGISKDDLPHIFEPFYRTDTSRTHQNQDGHGLGLAIVQEIIAKLNGSISVHSELDKGSVFSVKIPHSGSSQNI